jgi:hypothetical protein
MESRAGGPTSSRTTTTSSRATWFGLGSLAASVRFLTDAPSQRQPDIKMACRIHIKLFGVTAEKLGRLPAGRLTLLAYCITACA